MGVTTPEPFVLYAEELSTRLQMYEWGKTLSQKTSVRDLDLTRFVDPARFLQEVKSLIVVTDSYFEEDFPPSLAGKIGRCYLKGLFCPEKSFHSQRRKEFRKFLQGIGHEGFVRSGSSKDGRSQGWGDELREKLFCFC